MKMQLDMQLLHRLVWWVKNQDLLEDLSWNVLLSSLYAHREILISLVGFNLINIVVYKDFYYFCRILCIKLNGWVEKRVLIYLAQILFSLSFLRAYHVKSLFWI